MSKPDILERLMDYSDLDARDAAEEIKKLRCLRITDAERWALERAAVWMMTLAQDRREIQSAAYLADDAATLRGLLERHAKGGET